MANRLQGRYIPDPATGGMIDTLTDTIIMPGDPQWNPEWSTVAAQNQQAFAPGGSIANKYAAAQGPWYADPALLGTLALPVGAGILGAFGAGGSASAGAAGNAGDLAGEATLTSTPVATGGTAPGSLIGALGSSGSTSGPFISASDPTSILSKVGGLLKGAGAGIGGATNASMNNALANAELGLQANQQNISGQNAFVNQELAMAQEEAAQRAGALKDVYRASYAANPRVSPFDPVGPPKLSPQYMSTVNALSGQGASQLANPAKYNVAGLPSPTPYVPISPANVQGATGSAPGVLTKIGQWAGPAATIAGTILGAFGG